MGRFIGLFLCNLIIPVIMVVAGYMMYRHPPKNINAVVGYRTPMSCKNADTWAFAHDYCGKLWLKYGIILLVASAAAQLPFIRSSSDALGVMTLVLEGIQVAALVLSVIPTEKALKKNFDENGNRR